MPFYTFYLPFVSNDETLRTTSNNGNRIKKMSSGFIVFSRVDVLADNDPHF